MHEADNPRPETGVNRQSESSSGCVCLPAACVQCPFFAGFSAFSPPQGEVYIRGRPASRARPVVGCGQGGCLSHPSCVGGAVFLGEFNEPAFRRDLSAGYRTGNRGAPPREEVSHSPPT